MEICSGRTQRREHYCILDINLNLFLQCPFDATFFLSLEFQFSGPDGGRRCAHKSGLIGTTPCRSRGIRVMPGASRSRNNVAVFCNAIAISIICQMTLFDPRVAAQSRVDYSSETAKKRTEAQLAQVTKGNSDLKAALDALVKEDEARRARAKQGRTTVFCGSRSQPDFVGGCQSGGPW